MNRNLHLCFRLLKIQCITQNFHYFHYCKQITITMSQCNCQVSLLFLSPNRCASICVITGPISQDIGPVIMHILAKVHHKTMIVHGFMIFYPIVFIPVVQEKGLFQSAIMYSWEFSHLCFLPLVQPFYTLFLGIFSYCYSKAFFCLFGIQTHGFVMHFC